jgi:hypothetical protein
MQNMGRHRRSGNDFEGNSSCTDDQHPVVAKKGLRTGRKGRFLHAYCSSEWLPHGSFPAVPFRIAGHLTEVINKETRSALRKYILCMFIIECGCCWMQSTCFDMLNRTMICVRWFGFDCGYTYRTRRERTGRCMVVRVAGTCKSCLILSPPSLSLPRSLRVARVDGHYGFLGSRRNLIHQHHHCCEQHQARCLVDGKPYTLPAGDLDGHRLTRSASAEFVLT